MKAFRGILSAPLVLGLLACGTSSPGPSPAGAEIDSGAPGAARLGSYDLIGAGSAPARLDLTLGAAVIWQGGGGLYFTNKEITREGQTLTLAIADLVTYTFPLLHDGSFAGTFVVGPSNGTTTTGTITPDTTAPVASVSASPFPWRGAALHLSEPIDPSFLLKGLVVHHGPDLVPLADTPSLVPASLSAFAGEYTSDVTAVPKRWAALVGSSVDVSTSGLADPAGNVGAPSTSTVAFAAVPSRGALDFADGAASFVVAGQAGGAVFLDDASVCETGHCLELGPYSAGCGFAGVQLTAWLTSLASHSNVHVRYRILSDTTDATVSPQVMTKPITFQVAAEGGAISALSFEATPLPLSATTDLGFSRATAWQTATLALPVPTANIGIEISAGRTCADSPAKAPATEAVSAFLVGAITFD